MNLTERVEALRADYDRLTSEYEALPGKIGVELSEQELGHFRHIFNSKKGGINVYLGLAERHVTDPKKKDDVLGYVADAQVPLDTLDKYFGLIRDFADFAEGEMRNEQGHFPNFYSKEGVDDPNTFYIEESEKRLRAPDE
jgi:hypothetical protein